MLEKKQVIKRKLKEAIEHLAKYDNVVGAEIRVRRAGELLKEIIKERQEGSQEEKSKKISSKEILELLSEGKLDLRACKCVECNNAIIESKVKEYSITGEYCINEGAINLEFVCGDCIEDKQLNKLVDERKKRLQEEKSLLINEEEAFKLLQETIVDNDVVSRFKVKLVSITQEGDNKWHFNFKQVKDECGGVE